MKIIVDTREQIPWNFGFFGAQTISKKLDTGDYAIYGFQNELSIDRKASLSELYTNLFRDYRRFKKEVLRSKEMEFYIICEFPYSTIDSFPQDSGIPNKFHKTRGWTWDNLKWNGQDIKEKIDLLSERDGVNFLFCLNRAAAEQKAFNIMKDFYERNTKKS